jgi:quercetin dioxygenase-like cupin family protein
MSKPFRRVVTGHDTQGRAVILSDGLPERFEAMSPRGPWLREVWSTTETPASIDHDSSEPPEPGLILAPPKNGTRIRVCDFAPETGEYDNVAAEAARAQFARIGGAEHFTGGRHAMMHRTESVDYGIILEGEITLILDEQETTVHAGDIVVQRGTNHAWANRSGANCRVAFVLIDGAFADALQHGA